MNKVEHAEATFLAKSIYVGDPCYAVKDDIYNAWGDKYDYNDGAINVSKNNDSLSDFVVMGTAYGDGEYKSTKPGVKFPVDAGCICVADTSSCDWDKLKDLNGFGQLIHLPKYDVTKVVMDYDAGDISITVKQGSKVVYSITIITDDSEEDDASDDVWLNDDWDDEEESDE